MVVIQGFLFTCGTGVSDKGLCSSVDNFKDPRKGGVQRPTNLHLGMAGAEGYGKPNSV